MYNVLLVEDNPADAYLFEEYLHDAAPTTYNISTTDYLEKAWYLSQALYPEVVVIDLSLPDASGEQTLKLAAQYFKNKPIIILTGKGDIAMAKKAVAEGIQYFLIKQEVNGDLLDRSLQCAIERHRLTRRTTQRPRALARNSESVGWV